MNLCTHKLWCNNHFYKIISSADTEYGSNLLFFCGTFEDSLIQDFDTMTTSGASDFDAFIASTSLGFDDQWFAQEGRVALFVDESADAIDILDTTLFITGKMFNQSNVSNFWSWTYQNGTSPNFLNGAGPTSNYHSLYTIQCEPDGSIIDTTITGPLNTGVNESTDITALDTALVNSISNKVVQSFPHDFYDYQSQLHRAIVQNSSGGGEALLARLLPVSSNVGYYKRASEDYKNTRADVDSSQGLMIYPNPTAGRFEVKLPMELTGSVQVYDRNGRKVSSKGFSKQTEIFFEMELPAGLYFIQVQSISLEVYSGRIIIQD